MCMGPPAYLCLHIERNWVYPHVYGATFLWGGAPEGFEGLSPCVWGHPLRPRKFGNPGGSIPMCMGPPLLCLVRFVHRWVYPHVYGATVLKYSLSHFFWGLFPCIGGTQ